MAQGLPMLLPPFHLTNLFEVLCAKPISIRSGRFKHIIQHRHPIRLTVYLIFLNHNRTQPNLKLQAAKMLPTPAVVKTAKIPI